MTLEDMKKLEKWRNGLFCFRGESSSGMALVYSTLLCLQMTHLCSKRLLGDRLRHVHFLHSHNPQSFMSLCSNTFWYITMKFIIIIWWKEPWSFLHSLILSVRRIREDDAFLWICFLNCKIWAIDWISKVPFVKLYLMILYICI